MSQLRFEFDWDEPLGHSDALIKATMAHLSITVGDETVTVCRSGDSTRPYILTPLYPLAEWIAANWWPLTQERFTLLRRIGEQDFLARHSILQARDGFALPDLRFYPEDDWISLRWTRHRMVRQPLEFLSEGQLRLRREDIEQALAGFVECVLERLAQRGYRDSWVAQEWRAIQELSPEEAEFCRAAAKLGIDPFNSSEDTASIIRGNWDRLALSLRDDVFDATDLPNLALVTTWVEGVLQAAHALDQVNGLWSEIRTTLHTSPGQRPWEEGYDLARQVRDRFDWRGTVRAPIISELIRVLPTTRPPLASIDGMMVVIQHAPVCSTHKHRPESVQFACARALSEYLAENFDEPRLMSSAPTERQQRSRAFAAEFLAPATLIRNRLEGDVVTEEEIEDIAAEFGVSVWVIRHQIDNHELARIAGRS